jgi:hypothetical protein
MEIRRVLLIGEDDHAIDHEVPTFYTATYKHLSLKRRVTSGGLDGILGKDISVILIAPKEVDVDIDKIINAIDDVLNPVKLSVKDCKFYSTEDMYAEWLQNRPK